jgi:hypothetical protein
MTARGRADLARFCLPSTDQAGLSFLQQLSASRMLVRKIHHSGRETVSRYPPKGRRLFVPLQSGRAYWNDRPIQEGDSRLNCHPIVISKLWRVVIDLYRTK